MKVSLAATRLFNFGSTPAHGKPLQPLSLGARFSQQLALLHKPAPLRW